VTPIREARLEACSLETNRFFALPAIYCESRGEGGWYLDGSGQAIYAPWILINATGWMP
jgi:hypothetical protein